MMSRLNTNSMVWMEGDHDGLENKQEMEMGVFSTFKSMVGAEEEDWYAAVGASAGYALSMHAHNDTSFSPAFIEAGDSNQLILQPLNSSASCSPSAASVFNNLDASNHQVNYYLHPKSFISPISCNSLEGSFDIGCENVGYLENALNSLGAYSQMGSLSNSLFSGSNFIQLPQGGTGFNPFGVVEGSKILKPLDNFASIGAQPTLFQKRAALRKNVGNGVGVNLESLNLEEMNEGKRKNSSADDIEDLSYDSDDQFLDNNSGDKPDDNIKIDAKGKKKGMPAKNLMAERRRRKKLNDRLYMLRSVVPKISKMDRASILGDAIDYLKDLLQKINDLHNELESTPGSSSVTSGANFYPPTPTGTPPPDLLPLRIKEELCPSAFATPISSPNGQQPARVEVRLREGRAVNIHMFCGRRPGLLLSTLRAMDNLGLDVQQAVISCFNGFVLDVFRAEQYGEGLEVNPEQIKAVLLDSAEFHDVV